MGAGIAQMAAQAGHPVKLLDNRPGAAEQAVAGIRAQFAKLADKGKLTADAAHAAGSRLIPVEQLTDLADAGLVVEAIVEDLDAKQRLYADLEGIVGADCLFGTNTSSISVTAIGAALKRPERLAGLHFFNPAPLMALVEVVAGLATERGVAVTLYDTAAAWGKTPVHVKSTPGFIVNRVARPYYGEALRLLNEGAADCATLDALLREAGGFRMGPFELMDMIGLDIGLAVGNSVWQAFCHDPRFTPSLIQREMVAAGFLGRKSDRGFYDYHTAARPTPASEPVQTPPPALAVCGDSAAAQALAARLQAAGLAYARRSADDGRIAEGGASVLYVTDGRSATRRAAETKVANTVLIDHAIDYTKATRLAIAVAEQCEAAAADAAVGMLQAAGLAVSRLKDVPGLAVMRTVAMLANEAADVVDQGVADAAGVDTAMRLGVGYPRGPLAWAGAIGWRELRTVLRHLGDSYGESRYRVSPWIEQRYFATRGR
jgi:3-hydroxybutyryl-CoA dehydrogenase